MRDTRIAVIKLAVGISQSSFEVTSCRDVRIDCAKDYRSSGKRKDVRHPRCPYLVLERGLNDHRDLGIKIPAYRFKEELGDHGVCVSRELVVFDAVRVDVALLDLVTAYERQPDVFGEILSERRFS